MHYFYVPSGGTSKFGAKCLTTKELQKRLRELGQSTEGLRNVLIKRYENHVAQEGREEMGSDEAVMPHMQIIPLWSWWMSPRAIST